MNGGCDVVELNYGVRAPYMVGDPRFVQSFSLDTDSEIIRQFYQQYGFIVFDDILEPDEVDLSINDLWAVYPEANKDDPSTWEKAHHSVGFTGQEPIDGLQLWKNRQNPRVYAAFQKCYESIVQQALSEPLVACLDRGSLMRPTMGPHGRPEWMVRRIPHFDLNPFVWCGTNEAYYAPRRLHETTYDKYHLMLSEGNNTPSHGYPKLRAVLQLSESTEGTGGFECLPGFHRHLRSWCQLQRYYRNQKLEPFGWSVRDDDPISSNMQKITSRSGSLIVFTAELPHTMFPNESSNFRYAQYLRMTPLSTLELTPALLKKRRALLHAHFPAGFEVTSLGKEVFLLTEEEDGDEQAEQVETTCDDAWMSHLFIDDDVRNCGCFRIAGMFGRHRITFVVHFVSRKQVASYQMWRKWRSIAYPCFSYPRC